MAGLLQVDVSLLTGLRWADVVDPFNYHNYTLTTAHIHTTIFASIAVLQLIMIVTLALIGEEPRKFFYSKDEKEDNKVRNVVRKRLSWALSMFNSGLLFFITVYVYFRLCTALRVFSLPELRCFVSSLTISPPLPLHRYYFHQKSGFLRNPSQLVTFITHPENHDALWYSMDNIGAIIMIWFAVFNVMELLWGKMVAPEHMDPVTALVHHPFYTWMMMLGLTGNLLPFADNFVASVLVPVLGANHTLVVFITESVLPGTATAPFTTPFVICFLQELPTFALALASVFPSLRSDGFFGLSFFLLRICHNLLLWWHSPMGVKKALFTGSMTMHIVWFSAWCRKYLPAVMGMKKTALKAKAE